MKYVGFSQRLLAHNIDLIPTLGLFYLESMVIPSVGYDWLLFGATYFLYNTLFELSRWQGTPGKKWTKIRVEIEQKEYRELRIGLRNICKIFSLLLFFSGFIMIAFNIKRKALHDYIAGTLVLFNE